MYEDPLDEGPVRRGPQSRPESQESIWMLTIGPLIWAFHFLASYLTAAIYCAKASEDSGAAQPVQLAILLYTLLAVPAIAWVMWIGYRRHRLGDSSLPHDADTSDDRHRFLGFATVLLCALSLVATLYTLCVAIFAGTCY